jgi:hypothetical protein
MDTKKTKKPKPQIESNEDNLPEIDASSCEQFDPSGNQYLTDDDTIEEEYDE